MTATVCNYNSYWVITCADFEDLECSLRFKSDFQYGRAFELATIYMSYQSMEYMELPSSLLEQSLLAVNTENIGLKYEELLVHLLAHSNP